jgi:hypothetical protein
MPKKVQGKSEDALKFTDNGWGQKWVVLYDEHANTEHSSNGTFDAKIDDTDHTAFLCQKCDREARIVKLTYFKESRSDRNVMKLVYTLWFDLYCEGCGATGHKKL